ncbi:hypothetical protein SXCC_00650 [Gluconacetobacter sp. SXCC-1]|nr:hypothetical protein SXCC_00650 [Gluconacetobacter sp. SXCC-1]
MMQPVIRDTAIACSNGLHAMAVTRSDQACNISRTHRPLRFVTQGRQKWRKPYFQIRSPVGVHRQIPLHLVFHESSIASVGNPYSKFSAKVVLDVSEFRHERIVYCGHHALSTNHTNGIGNF